jgi:hypothetical protein
MSFNFLCVFLDLYIKFVISFLCKDNTVKILNFLQLTGFINRILKPSQCQTRTRLELCNTLPLPACYTDEKLDQLDNRLNPD